MFFCNSQFVCGYYWFACEQFVGSRTKGTGNSAMQQSYSFGICYRFSSGHPCSDFLPSDYWHLYGKYVSDAIAICLVVMLLNYVFALPGYVYMNGVTGTGATRMTFIFQLITIAAYQIYLWSISGFSTSLSVYWTVEYLYVILLGLLSVIYLKHKHY